jgi:hypothetical protein
MRSRPTSTPRQAIHRLPKVHCHAHKTRNWVISWAISFDFISPYSAFLRILNSHFVLISQVDSFLRDFKRKCYLHSDIWYYDKNNVHISSLDVYIYVSYGCLNPDLRIWLDYKYSYITVGTLNRNYRWIVQSGHSNLKVYRIQIKPKVVTFGSDSLTPGCKR